MFEAYASTTAWLIAEGLASLDPTLRDHILERWRDERDHGPSLVRDGGCDVRLGRVSVGMVARAALLEWLPLARRELAVYEGGLFEDEPAHAITLLVRPPTIWSLDDARLAARLHPLGRRFDPERFAAIERHARERTGVEQLTRVREAVGRIEVQLPVAAFPVASALVAAGCAVVAADESWSRLVAARQLARYASSAVVAAFA
jgi:hypothetical protein